MDKTKGFLLKWKRRGDERDTEMRLLRKKVGESNVVDSCENSERQTRGFIEMGKHQTSLISVGKLQTLKGCIRGRGKWQLSCSSSSLI